MQPSLCSISLTTSTINHPGNFRRRCHVSPFTFDWLLELIKNHPIFHNNSNKQQLKVRHQCKIYWGQVWFDKNKDYSMNCQVCVGSLLILIKLIFDSLFQWCTVVASLTILLAIQAVYMIQLPFRMHVLPKKLPVLTIFLKASGYGLSQLIHLPLGVLLNT